MKTLLATICAMSLASAALAEYPPPTPAGTMSRLSQSAGEELARSIDELNALREQIAAEKLPLSQELTALEENLALLRRDHERISRLVDAGHLEMATINAEMKARQDELTYISNILDEYARGFESKVNISELQYLGRDIEAAKQAFEDKTLSPADKFTRQTAFVTLSMSRLFDAVGGMRFAGTGVDADGHVAEGQYAIVGPVALFRSTDGAASGVVVPQSGSTNPLIRPLEGPMQAGLISLVSNGEGVLPLDPSRGGALQAIVQKAPLIHIFKKGGLIMWPLLAASVLALAVVLERLLFLFIESLRRSPKTQQKFFAAVEKGSLAEAIAIGKKSKFFVVRALGYALEHKETSLSSALLLAQAREIKRFQRGVSILDTVITLAPLLGLLGTVTGMMGSFKIIGGDLGSPGAITGGIAEALIATAFGLGIAITALLPFNFLNTRTDQARHELEAASTQLELLVTQGAARAGREAPSAGEDQTAHAAADEDSERRERELRRKREALRRRMAELESELEEQELQIQTLSEPARGHESRRPQTVKE